MSKECDCGCEDPEECCEDVEMSAEELSENNNLLINALIDLLIEKKVITEDEFNKKVDDADVDDEE